VNVEFSEEAKEEFKNMEQQLQLFFKTHLEKLKNVPPRRHLKFGLPHHVENVTKQTCLVYDMYEDRIYVVHCFATHKEYEKWYKSYK